MLTYDFRLPPGPRTVEYAILAEDLGFRAVWCPEVPAFGHDIWVTLARIAENTKRIKFGPSVLIPSYRHPMAQASAVATLEQIAPGRLMVGFGTGFTGRAGMGKKPLSLASMRTHIAQVRALLRGDVAEIDGGLAQILASHGWLPDRPINVPVYMAGQGPKARALAKEIADGLISLGGPAEGFETCLVSTGGTVLDDGEDVTSPRASTAVKPLIALAYHHRYTTDPESEKALPNGKAWLASVERVDENVRHLSVHRGHNLDVSNGHDALVDVSAAKQMTFTGTREELRERLAQLEARGATSIIFGTSGSNYALLQLDDGMLAGHRVVSAQMMAELHRPEIAVGADWTAAARIQNLHYALGWFTADVRGMHLVYHNGANPGFRAAIVLAPSAKAGVVVMTNGESDRFAEAAARSLLEQLLR